MRACVHNVTVRRERNRVYSIKIDLFNLKGDSFQPGIAWMVFSFLVMGDSLIVYPPENYRPIGQNEWYQFLIQSDTWLCNS